MGLLIISVIQEMLTLKHKNRRIETVPFDPICQTPAVLLARFRGSLGFFQSPGLTKRQLNVILGGMGTKQYTIEDLCELTGFSRRTIRYYVQEGLIDPPAGRGRGGFYFDSHLDKLLKIKSLQDRGLRLSAILPVLKQRDVLESPQEIVAREVWVRYPIADGIEIHISRDLEEKERKKLDEIVRLARSILKGGEVNEE
jgi:DNA-binding transcriptional MerR regulator